MVRAILFLSVVAVASAQGGEPDFPDCPESLDAVYADMHDGDKKRVIISSVPLPHSPIPDRPTIKSTITIQPSGNDQKWKTQTDLDRGSCQSATIDFNVPGKPGHPPVNLQASFWRATSPNATKSLWGFEDPSGSLVNCWVAEMAYKPEEPYKFDCEQLLKQTWKKGVYADMHDGDNKEVTIAGTSMTIKPSGNNQTWVVESKFDRVSCSASIDFNVPGKPNPPPVNLLASLYLIYQPYGYFPHVSIEFTDPSGTLASAGAPLNHWAAFNEISRESEPTVLLV